MLTGGVGSGVDGGGGCSRWARTSLANQISVEKCGISPDNGKLGSIPRTSTIRVLGEDILGGGGGGEGGAVAAFEARLGAPVACEDQPSALRGDHISGGPLLAAVCQRAVHLVRLGLGLGLGIGLGIGLELG